MSNKTVDHLLEELEDQFHSVQSKLIKAKDDYVKKHSKEYLQAKKRVDAAKKKFETAKKRSSAAATNAKKKGTSAAHNQVVKAKAAMSVVGEALGEAKEIMFTAQSKLKSTKPLERKLAARARAMAAFEREWEKKTKAEEKKKAATKKKAAAKKARKKATTPRKTAAKKKLRARKPQ